MNQLSKEKYDDLISKGYSPTQIASEARRRGFSLPSVGAAPAPAEGKSVGGFVSNAGSSFVKAGTDIVGGLVAAVSDIPGTAKALGQTALGGIEKFVPGEQESEKVFDAVVESMAEKYKDGLFNALYTDPFGVALDASTVAGGAGLGLRAAGALGKVSKVGALAEASSVASKAGAVATRLGDAVDPLYHAMNIIGRGVTVPKSVLGVAVPGIVAGRTTPSLAGAGRLISRTIAGAPDVRLAEDLATLGKSASNLPSSAGRVGGAARRAEIITGNTAGGASLGEKFLGIEDFIEDAGRKMAEKLKAADKADYGTVGKIISDTVDGWKQGFQKAKDEAYSYALKTEGTARKALGNPAPISGAISEANKLFTDVKGSTDPMIGELKKIRTLLKENTNKEGAVSLKAGRAIENEVSRIKDTYKNGQDYQRVFVETGLEKAVEQFNLDVLEQNFGDRFKKLKEAEAAYISYKNVGAETLSNMVQRAIETKEYGKLIDGLFSTGASGVTTESVSRLMSSLDDSQKAAVRSATLNKIMDLARKETGGEALSGSKFKNAVKNLGGNRVEAVFGKDGAKLLGAFERTVNKLNSVSGEFKAAKTAQVTNAATDIGLFMSMLGSLGFGNVGLAAGLALTLGGKKGLQALLASEFGQQAIRNGADMSGIASGIGNVAQETRRAAVAGGGAVSELPL